MVSLCQSRYLLEARNCFSTWNEKRTPSLSGEASQWQKSIRSLDIARCHSSESCCCPIAPDSHWKQSEAINSPLHFIQINKESCLYCRMTIPRLYSNNTAWTPIHAYNKAVKPLWCITKAAEMSMVISSTIPIQMKVWKRLDATGPPEYRLTSFNAAVCNAQIYYLIKYMKYDTYKTEFVQLIYWPKLWIITNWWKYPFLD